MLRQQQFRHRMVWAALVLILALLILIAGYLISTSSSPAGGGGGASASGAIAEVSPIDPSKVVKDPATGRKMVSNEIIVMAKSLEPKDITMIEREIGGTLVGKVPRFGLLQFRLPPDTRLNETLSKIERLKKSMDLESVGPNCVDEPQALFPIDGRGFQKTDWDMNKPAGENWGLEWMRAPLAWDVTTGLSTVKIGILDRGFDRTHPDLQSNVDGLTAYASGGDGSHGCHVAGIAAGSGDNQIGICGLAYGCRLVLYEVDGSYTNHVAAIGRAIADGCLVINRSWGPAWDHRPGSEADVKRRDAEEERWRPVLRDLEQKAVVLVNSAGNDAIDTTWCAPASLAPQFDNVISVANATESGTLAASSNHGDSVTVAAPGTDIWSTIRVSSGSYGAKDGTSMAAPYIAGLVGLVYSADLEANPEAAKPTLTPGDVKRLIEEGARSRGHSLDGGNFYIADAASPVRKASGGSIGDEGSATCIVMDVSGSMTSPAAGGNGSSKLDAAKTAAERLLSVVRADAEAHGVEHEFALVPFSDQAELAQELTADLDTLKDAVKGLSAQNRTNMGAGLDLGLEQLDAATANSKLIVLLSDGLPNEGLSSGELSDASNPDTPVARAAAAGIRVFTVGFGDRTSQNPFIGLGTEGIDEKLLQAIADTTGGSYFFADDAFRLQNAYLQMHHKAMGQVLNTYSGKVAQGERQELGTQEIAPNTAEMYATCNYPGSQINLLMTDPSGRVVDDNYPGAHIVSGCPASLFIRKPMAGEWKCGVLGVDCPAGGEPFEVALSSRTGKEPPIEYVSGGSGVAESSDYTPALIVAFGCVLLLMAITMVSLRRSRSGRTVSQHTMVWTMWIREPGQPARPVRQQAQALTVGRSTGNQVVLWDPSVSRVHLQVRKTQYGYVVRDLGSNGGTWIGSVRLMQPTLLHSGDTIRAGRTTITFG